MAGWTEEYLPSGRMGSTSFGNLSTESQQQFHNSPQNGNTDIYWISASVINELREKATF